MDQIKEVGNKLPHLNCLPSTEHPVSKILTLLLYCTLSVAQYFTYCDLTIMTDFTKWVSR